jgi:hypothetical protein
MGIQSLVLAVSDEDGRERRRSEFQRQRRRSAMHMLLHILHHFATNAGTSLHVFQNMQNMHAVLQQTLMQR